MQMKEPIKLVTFMISLSKGSSQTSYYSVNTRISCQYSLSMLNVTTQTSNRICLYLFQRTIWDLPTNWEICHKISLPRYKEIHIAQTLSFKMIYHMSGLLPYLGCKTIISLSIPLFSFDFWHVQWVVFPLVPWRILSLILWEQVSLLNMSKLMCTHLSHSLP